MQKSLEPQTAVEAVAAHADTQVLNLAKIPAETLRGLREELKLNDTQISDIFEAVQAGVRTPAEFLGMTDPIANTVEQMALTFYRDRHYVHATTLYQFLVEVCPKRATAWRGMGACMQALKIYPAAVLSYYEARDRDPEDPVALVLLGETLVLCGARNEGLKHLALGVEKGGDKPAYALYVKRAAAVIASQQEAINLEKKKTRL